MEEEEKEGSIGDNQKTDEIKKMWKRWKGRLKRNQQTTEEVMMERRKEDRTTAAGREK